MKQPTTTTTTTTSAVTGQLTTTSHHIFITLIKQSDGSTKPVMSAQPLSDQSFRMNSEAHGSSLFLLMGWCLQNKSALDQDQSPLMRLVTRVLAYRMLPYDIWGEILGFFSGFSQDDSNPLASLGNYAVAIRRPPSLFQAIEMDPFVVVDAAMRGQEDMVMNILKADPSYLLKKAKVKNSVGVEHDDVTPLQAAIMANDIQMVERMREYFDKRLTVDLDGKQIDGLDEMHRQIKEIYTRSLNRYWDTQLDILSEQKKQQLTLLHELRLSQELTPSAVFTTEQRNQYAKTEEKIKQAERSISVCKSGMNEIDIHKIIEAHNQVQELNAFDFQPYVDAILDPTLPQAELDEVMELINATTPQATQAAIAKGVSPVEIGFIKNDRAYTRPEVQAMPLSELTLIQKLNRFREKLTQHMQQEIIFNPHHILAGLKINETTWDTLPHTQDPQYKKRSIIFSQLVGRAQGIAAAPVKQDICQGTYYLTAENEPRTRPSRFNTWDSMASEIVRNSLVDVSLINSSSFEGVGYKFGGGAGCFWLCYPLQKLCRAKTASFQNLLRAQSERELTNRGA